MAPWCSVYHCSTISFKYAWTQVLHMFKFYTRYVGDLHLRESLTMVPAGQVA